jgi:uncharacterized membrane protein YoaK (UPF0700 family)
LAFCKVFCEKVNMSVVELKTSVLEREQHQKLLAVCLTMTAGYVDGYGLLVLGTYVSFMSGNTTMTGVMIGKGSLLAALSPAIAVLSFVAGSFAANLVIHSPLRHAHCALLGLIAAIISLGLANDGMNKYAEIAILALAMGMVNPALSRIGAEAISLTFMTGTLNRIGSHLALALLASPAPGSEGPWDTHLYRAGWIAWLWASFIGGAILSGFLMSFIGAFALLPAIAMMVALTLLSVATSLRSH